MSSFNRRGFYRYPFGRSRFGYRRGYNRYWRRNWARARSVTVAQRNGTRRFNVTVPIHDLFTMTVAAGAYWSDLHAVSPYYRGLGAAANTRLQKGALVTSPLYETYAALYDEVKINSCVVTLSIMSSVGIGGVVPALKIYTSWDRDASYQEVVYGQGAPTVDQLMNGSESQVTLVTNTSSSTVRRYNRASDLMERVKFHDCTMSKTAQRVTDLLYGSDTGYAQMGYCPCMFFALNTASAPGEGQTYSFSISVEVRWNVTFRNPKYGLSASASKMGEVKSGVVGDDDDTEIVVGDGNESKKVGESEDMKDEEVRTDMTDEEIQALLKKLKEKG